MEREFQRLWGDIERTDATLVADVGEMLELRKQDAKRKQARPNPYPNPNPNAHPHPNANPHPHPHPYPSPRPKQGVLHREWHEKVFEPIQHSITASIARRAATTDLGQRWRTAQDEYLVAEKKKEVRSLGSGYWAGRGLDIITHPNPRPISAPNPRPNSAPNPRLISAPNPRPISAPNPRPNSAPNQAGLFLDIIIPEEYDPRICREKDIRY